MKKKFLIIVSFVCLSLVLVGCGTAKNNIPVIPQDNIVETFPTDSYIPSIAKYSYGNLVLVKDLSSDNYMNKTIYIDQAFFSDVKSYVSNLKTNGIKYAHPKVKETINVNSDGLYAWYGENKDKTFAIQINYYNQAKTVQDAIKGNSYSYNLEIVLLNNSMY